MGHNIVFTKCETGGKVAGTGIGIDLTYCRMRGEFAENGMCGK